MKCKCKCSYCRRKIKELEGDIKVLFQFKREDAIKIKELELRILKSEFIR